jgi:hypothetical protein
VEYASEKLPPAVSNATESVPFCATAVVLVKEMVWVAAELGFDSEIVSLALVICEACAALRKVGAPMDHKIRDRMRRSEI